MRGAIAAGSAVTAAAGAEILENGGNAIDAVVAACLACAAGEPTLTSLAGGGVLLYRDGKSGELTLCDFFSNAPGVGGGDPPPQLDFYGVDLNFGPAIQRFHIGAASAAVPGAIPGLFTAQERWGGLPLSVVIEPACRALRDGVVLGAWQASAAALLTPILTATEASKRQFAPTGRLIGEGDRYCIPGLADTLEALAKEGWRKHYDGPLRQALLASSGREAGGLLTAADLDAYEVLLREPLAFDYRGHRVHSNPPPAAGGELIGLLLSLLEVVPAARREAGSEAWLHALCQAMRVCEQARALDAGRVMAPARVAHWREAYAALLDQPLASEPPDKDGPPSTTHVSVIDAEGNAAAVTFSYGEGNGIMIGESGIMNNNLMGEDDLFPQGFFRWPVGTRLATMMSPTIFVSPEGDIVVMGTGGSNRIRTALPQVIAKLLEQPGALDPRSATEASRVHFEAGVLSGETFDDAERAAVLERLGPEKLVLFEQPNLFFGGVHLVCKRADGTLDGAGDPRRAGTCVVV